MAKILISGFVPVEILNEGDTHMTLLYPNELSFSSVSDDEGNCIDEEIGLDFLDQFSWQNPKDWTVY